MLILICHVKRCLRILNALDLSIWIDLFKIRSFEWVLPEQGGAQSEHSLGKSTMDAIPQVAQTPLLTPSRDHLYNDGLACHYLIILFERTFLGFAQWVLLVNFCRSRIAEASAFSIGRAAVCEFGNTRPVRLIPARTSHSSLAVIPNPLVAPGCS